MKKTNKKGFTLAELLVVVAIIAVLVAIAIPIFTAQLEKAREATDAANLRAAYAEVVTAGLTEDSVNYSKTVAATQKTAGWQGTDYSSKGSAKIGGMSVEATTTSWTVKYDATTSAVTITVVS